ncbi:hypothetical protein KJK34_13960 [Flavobacterium sp. D11R37]|uniref:HEPN domain-containing protein n=1 Tax=Flavobacterium coralii TaxID=2838017 RepID=UPI001CA794CB|nr:HEPN domain-containing protein [Flavobacterium coralii]MBY8963861.1 hypothetical protein [Flavobacterium coralii]
MAAQKKNKTGTELEQNERIYTNIAIFTGSFVDLNVLDLSMLNLRFMKFKSAEFNKLVKQTEYHKGQIARVIKGISEEHLDNDRLQVLLPINFSKPVKKEDLWLVRDILLVIFPSDIAIARIIDFQLLGNKIGLSGILSYEFRTTGEDTFANYLFLYEHEIQCINQFIPIYIERYNKIPYLTKTIHAYLSSFFQSFSDMEYLSLCIALESIINGKTELTYRIRRNIAIILASDVELGKIVFKNIGDVYDLRSAIAHSTGEKYDRIRIYLPYLRKVISRLIVELISLNIHDIDKLNSELSYIGFGDRGKLSENYVEYKLSTSVWAGVFNDIREEYKNK